MSGDWTLVDGNPAPGNPQRIRNKGDAYTTIAQIAGEAKSELMAIKDDKACAVWEGQASEHFGDTIESKFLTKLRKLDDSYSSAGKALLTYATSLERLQVEADAQLSNAYAASDSALEGERRMVSTAAERSAAEAEVRRLEEDLRTLDNEYYRCLATRSADDATYDARYNSWRNRYSLKKSTLNTARDRYNSACRSHDNAENDTNDARGRLRRARNEVADIKRRRETAEKEAADKIDAASKLGIKNKSWLSKRWEWVSNLENLDKLIGWTSMILTGLAVILAFTPLAPAAGVLFAVAAGLNVIKAGIAVTLATQGRKSWFEAGVDVVMAIVSVVTLGSGSIVSPGKVGGRLGTDSVKSIAGAAGKGWGTAAEAGVAASGRSTASTLTKVLATDTTFVGRTGYQAGDAIRTINQVRAIESGSRWAAWSSAVKTNFWPTTQVAREVVKERAINEMPGLLIRGADELGVGVDNVFGLLPDEHDIGEGRLITDKARSLVGKSSYGDAADPVVTRAAEVGSRLCPPSTSIPPISVDVSMRPSAGTSGGGGSW